MSKSKPRPRRWLRALLGLFLVGLLAVGGAAFWLWQQYQGFVDAPVAGLSVETDVILQRGDGLRRVLQRLEGVGLETGREELWRLLAREMNVGGRIQAAIELLQAIHGGSAPADRAAAAYFRNRRYIGGKDRRDVLDHAYGVLRRRARLGRCLGFGMRPAAPRRDAAPDDNAVLDDEAADGRIGAGGAEMPARQPDGGGHEALVIMPLIGHALSARRPDRGRSWQKSAGSPGRNPRYG